VAATRTLSAGLLGLLRPRTDQSDYLKPSPGRTVNEASGVRVTHVPKLDFPDDESMRISHEAVYQALYIQDRGALKRELILCPHTGRALRAPRERSRRKTWAHVTPEALISEHPAEAEDRAVPGHWEGDLLIGLERSAIGTVVERTTQFTMLVHLPDKRTTTTSTPLRTVPLWPATARSR
jgi:IS30 family transposase